MKKGKKGRKLVHVPEVKGANLGKARMIMRAWQEKAIKILNIEAVQFLFIAISIGIIHAIMFVLPVITWIPNIDDANAFLKTLWQIHASVLGIAIIVITIIITVIANEKDRTRTWKLYVKKTKFIHIIWFNLLAILSEGLASLQTYRAISPISVSDRAGNLIISEGALLTISILLTAWLLTVTVKFLDDDYIEDLEEKRIIRLMPNAVAEDMQRIEKYMADLKSRSNGN